MTDYAHLTRRGQIRRMRRLAERALARYTIEPASLFLLGHLVNTTFALTGKDGSRYVLRIHQVDDYLVHSRRTQRMVESELWWLERLRTEGGLPVPAPVPAPSGERVVTVAVEGVSEPRPCVLFRWVDGRFLHHRLLPAHLAQVGRLMAHLHEDSTQLTVPAGFQRDRVDQTDGEVAEAVIRLFRDRWSAEAAEVVRAVLQRVHQTQDELGRNPDTFGLIHGDMHQENYFFSDGKVHLIDFDDCGWGYYLYDLAVTVHNIDTLPRGSALRQALVAGYRQVRDLSPAHEATMGMFSMLRELQMVTWFLEGQDDPSLSDRQAHIAHGLTMMQRFLAGGGQALPSQM